MRVLITGASGFAGRWLARELARDRSLRLFGLARALPDPQTLPAQMKLYRCDLNDTRRLEAVLRRIRPDRIHHLAGQASVSLSWKDPAGTRRDIVGATRSLLNALRRAGLRPAIHLAGSAEVYGRQRARRIAETAVPRPRNPYAAAKLLQEKQLQAYARKTGAPVVITRAFNHVGPGQSVRFALSDFAGQIARLEKGGERSALKTGNLSAVRDFADVRDVVRAYVLALKTAEGVCVYNVATGRGRTLGSVVRRMASLSRVPVRIVRDPARVRAEDLPRLVGDPSKIRRCLGWSPRMTLERTLLDILEYGRKQTKKGHL